MLPLPSRANPVGEHTDTLVPGPPSRSKLAAPVPARVVVVSGRNVVVGDTVTDAVGGLDGVWVAVSLTAAMRPKHSSRSSGSTLMSVLRGEKEDSLATARDPRRLLRVTDVCSGRLSYAANLRWAAG